MIQYSFTSFVGMQENCKFRPRNTCRKRVTPQATSLAKIVVRSWFFGRCLSASRAFSFYHFINFTNQYSIIARWSNEYNAYNDSWSFQYYRKLFFHSVVLEDSCQENHLNWNATCHRVTNRTFIIAILH